MSSPMTQSFLSLLASVSIASLMGFFSYTVCRLLRPPFITGLLLIGFVAYQLIISIYLLFLIVFLFPAVAVPCYIGAILHEKTSRKEDLDTAFAIVLNAIAATLILGSFTATIPFFNMNLSLAYVSALLVSPAIAPMLWMRRKKDKND